MRHSLYRLAWARVACVPRVDVVGHDRIPLAGTASAAVAYGSMWRLCGDRVGEHAEERSSHHRLTTRISQFVGLVNVNTTDATAGATALLLPAQNTHTLHDPKRDAEHARAGGVEDGLGVCRRCAGVVYCGVVTNTTSPQCLRIPIVVSFRAAWSSSDILTVLSQVRSTQMGQQRRSAR